MRLDTNLIQDHSPFEARRQPRGAPDPTRAAAAAAASRPAGWSHALATSAVAAAAPPSVLIGQTRAVLSSEPLTMKLPCGV